MKALITSLFDTAIYGVFQSAIWGCTLTGQLFDVADLSVPVAEITTTDDSFSEGFSGIFTAGFTEDVLGSRGDATFDNYSLSVPEPSSFLMCGLGFVCLLASRRK
jgi:hypothetical protein